MQLRIGNRIFAPSILATVLTLLLLPLFINLGCWQLRRADEKRALMSQAAAGQSRIVELNAANAGQLPRYQHVSARGVFDASHQILLDNMPSSAGQPGYRVWTPLRLRDGSIVLIDRGWIGNWMTGSGSKKSYPVIDVNDQERSVTGLIDELPRPGIRAGSAGAGEHWPQVLNYPRIEELKALYGPSLQSRILLMDAENADGLERRWQIKQGLTPERHIAYAVQWFGFAVTLVIIYIAVNLKNKSQA